MTQLDWQTYFASLAAEHVSLRHTLQQPHFFRGELEEFFSGFRSRVNFPALIFESSLLDVGGDLPNQHQRRTMAIIVTQTHTRDDWGEIASALAQCETIGLDLLGRLQHDIAETDTGDLSQCRLLDIHGEPLSNQPDKYVGWRFEFVVQETACLYHATNFLSLSNE